jgi:hypothetical protein
MTRKKVGEDLYYGETFGGMEHGECKILMERDVRGGERYM